MQVLGLFALIASIGCACAAILIRKDSKKLFWINTVLAVANGGLAIMGFTDVTHFTIGCSGDMFEAEGQLWCTNDWIIKLSETVSDEILKKYHK